MSGYHRCRFFNGIQHDKCEAGVRYRDVRDETSGPNRWPCLRLIGQRECATECAKRSLLSADELRAERDEIEAAVRRVVAALKAGKCHVCGADIEPSQVVGRCKYAACGHRIGQVASDEDLLP